MLVADAMALGFTRSALKEAVLRGDIVRPSYGVLAAPHAKGDQHFDDAVACLVTGGVVWLETAAGRHGLSDDMPDAPQILVPHTITRQPGTKHISMTRTRLASALEVGVEEARVLGVTVRMTGKPRTVVDLYRHGKTYQHALQSLHTYLGEGGTGQEIMAVAKHILNAESRAWDNLQRDIGSFLMAVSRSYSP